MHVCLQPTSWNLELANPYPIGTNKVASFHLGAEGGGPTLGAWDSRTAVQVQVKGTKQDVADRETHHKPGSEPNQITGSTRQKLWYWYGLVDTFEASVKTLTSCKSHCCNNKWVSFLFATKLASTYDTLDFRPTCGIVLPCKWGRNIRIPGWATHCTRFLREGLFWVFTSNSRPQQSWKGNQRGLEKRT